MEGGGAVSKIGILTHSFVDAYNGRLDRLFGGGLERYIYNLCSVIKEMGAEPEVHQLSFHGAFERYVEDIRVFGYHCSDMRHVQDTFNLMSEQAEGRLIYSSHIWTPLKYRRGSMGICHGINWDHPHLAAEQKNEIRGAVQHALDYLEQIVSVDSHFLTYCRSACHYWDLRKVKLIPNAVDTTVFTPRERVREGNAVRILFPRRISQERGIIPMIIAADRILEVYPQVTVEFAGEVIRGDALCDAFLSWVGCHPDRDRIFHHVYPFGQVSEAYRNADIAVIPSTFSEGTSYSCLEALSSGVAVVSSDVGGLNDLILDEYNGLSVAPDENELAIAISRLIDSPELRHRLAVRARETALAFDQSVWKMKWKTVIEKFLQQNAVTV
jgi:glycosyltransferase involved in cell wall biosynthesis